MESYLSIIPTVRIMFYKLGIASLYLCKAKNDFAYQRKNLIYYLPSLQKFNYLIYTHLKKYCKFVLI